MSTTTAATYMPETVNTRVNLAGLWTSTMFVIAFVDLFSFYRPDVRADIEAGEVSAFTINQAFLLGAVTYVAIPSLMVVASLMLRASICRKVSMVMAVLYAVTIVGGAIGEWGYYVLGSVIELVLLALVVMTAKRWPTATGQDDSSVTR